MIKSDFRTISSCLSRHYFLPFYDYDYISFFLKTILEDLKDS